MDKVLHNIIKNQILSLKNLQFNDFINQLYIIAYEGSRFTPIKQKQDKGCDGILDNEIVIAAYSPEKYETRKFKNKVTNSKKDGDFDKYQINWKDKGYKWRFIYNGEITTESRNFILELEKEAEIIDINHILTFIDSLEWHKKRNIIEYLDIDGVYFINDILSEIIDDLIKGIKPDDIIYKKVLYIEDKVRLNYSQDDVDMALDEYRECLECFPNLRSLLAAYNGENISALRSRIRNDYMKYHGNFKERLNYLTEEYIAKYKNDDIYKFYVRVVLIYYFEDCLIGKKTEDEK